MIADEPVVAGGIPRQRAALALRRRIVPPYYSGFRTVASIVLGSGQRNRKLPSALAGASTTCTWALGE